MSRHNNGLSSDELSHISGAFYFLKKKRWWSDLWWLVTDKGTSREVIATIWKGITKLQASEKLPRYSLLVFETDPKLHGNIVFPGTEEMAQRLKASRFGSIIEIQRVDDPARLCRDYLAKERTVQANYKRSDLGRRRKGSHKLPGGGDRVRLSDELARDAIDANYVKWWPRTYARRSENRKSYKLRDTGPHARSPKPAGQLSLMPEIERQPCRLRDFGGGYIPPAVAREIEFRRRQQGLSQRQVGKLIGRSQGQIANAMRGHDPLSSSAVNRLRELLLVNLK